MIATVISKGYGGLVTGACISDVGLNVICADTNLKKIQNLKNEILPIYDSSDLGSKSFTYYGIVTK